MTRDPWYYYSRALDNYKQQLEQLDYSGVASNLSKTRLRTQGFYTVSDHDNHLTLGSIKMLLNESTLGPPHGFDLLEPLPLPKFPTFPERPETSPPIQKPEMGFSIFGSPWRPPKYQVDPRIEAKEKDLREQTATLHQNFGQKYQTAKTQLDTLKSRCIASDHEAIRLLISLSHARHELPSVFRRFWEVDLDQRSRILLCTFELPDFSSLTISKSRGNSWKTKSVAVLPQSVNDQTKRYSIPFAFVPPISLYNLTPETGSIRLRSTPRRNGMTQQQGNQEKV
jgi:hypothetical protein